MCNNNWIWLPESVYPNSQKTKYSVYGDGDTNYTVTEFSREYIFEKDVKNIEISVTGDTVFMLYCNNEFLFRGPASVGGDFLCYNEQREEHYLTTVTLKPNKDNKYSFSALVRMGVDRTFEYSGGHGGFYLTGKVNFSDGTTEIFKTDNTWLCRKIGSYRAKNNFDNSVLPDKPVNAEVFENNYRLINAVIPPCEENLLKNNDCFLDIKPNETVEKTVEFDKIYAGYFYLKVKTDNRVEITLLGFETEKPGCEENFVFVSDGEYKGFVLRSLGGIKIIAKSVDATAYIDFGTITSNYPITTQVHNKTSDKDLDLVFDTCMHSLKYCRQTLHLDSPQHCEPLACTGDYYIETLMTAMTFGDMRLAELDVIRTAENLEKHDGRMFHTTYSLIWVQMLYDTYMLTGNFSLFTRCRKALDLLLKRFRTYYGDNGILENSPDYMFIDWLIPDGINTHHPPKALGQTCLNLFYYGALKTAEKIYNLLGEKGISEAVKTEYENLHTAIKNLLWDSEKELFFEGLNTPTDEKLLYKYLPQNVSKRFYRRHANILAAYFEFFDKNENQKLLDRIYKDESLGEVQPYFQHFWLEAIYRNGMRDKYTLKLLEQWKAPVKECPKGLPEGFYPPTPDYSFDHSHAWGGSPAYSLPLALSGLKILEPGYKKISLSPSLIGLESADIQIPTPYGLIEISQKKGLPVQIKSPKNIVVEMRKDFE